MILYTIPYEFILKHTRLDWSEVAYGLDNGYIAPDVAIEAAVSRLCEDDSASADEVELAGLSRGDIVTELVERLSGYEFSENEESKDKWLFLVLAWLYEIRESLDDPRRLIEEVYEHFDYPEEMSAFVRDMYTEDPYLKSKEANEARFYAYWKTYLDEASVQRGFDA
jgi:hypothetical protein